MTMFDDLQLFSGICLISVCLLAQYMLDLAKVKAYSKLLLFSSFVVVANVLKGVYWDIPNMDTNFYWYFGVNKDAEYSTIKQAYRDLALNLHPDQNLATGADEQFNLLTFMHGILHDAGKRDIYNRFGILISPNSDGDTISILDPRSDEFDLVMKITIVYLFWGLVAFIWTIPSMYRAARSWAAILLGLLAFVECMFSLSNSTIPEWCPVPAYLTEHELISFIHASVPCGLILLSAMSEYCYKDPNDMCVQIIGDLIKQQKVRVKRINEDMISYLRDLIQLNSIATATVAASGDADGKQLLTQTKDNVGKVLTHLEVQKQELLSLNKSILTSLEEYKLLLIGNKNDPLAKLYWYAIIAALFGTQYIQSKE